MKNYGLTERDIEVILGVGKYRYLRASQIQRLYYPSRRVANRRLALLSRYGYLKRFFVPELMGSMQREYTYCLGRKGLGLVWIKCASGLDGFPKSLKSRPEESSFIPHLLDLNQVRLALELACKGAGIKILKFIADYDTCLVNGQTKRATEESTSDPYDSEKTIVFAPDATFVLENSKRNQALFFLEVDRGTEKIESAKYSDFADKLVNYASYYRYDGFKRHGEHFRGFRVLVVTNSEARIEAYRRSAEKIGVKRLVWFTTFGKLYDNNILGHIWKIADCQDNNFYSILGSR